MPGIATVAAIVSRFYRVEFGVFLLLGWLPTKARESQICLVIKLDLARMGSRDEFIHFQKYLCNSECNFLAGI